MMSVGGYGVISVASHVVGPEMSSMIQAFVDGDVQTAAMWQGRLLPIYDTLFEVSSPAPLKAALDLIGISGGNVRLPLVAAPDWVVDHLRRDLERLGKL
jgi:4-hydroxy-tetrahydrodipicolinate synthase